jgi:hypothetical protein
VKVRGAAVPVAVAALLARAAVDPCFGCETFVPEEARGCGGSHLSEEMRWALALAWMVPLLLIAFGVRAYMARRHPAAASLGTVTVGVAVAPLLPHLSELARVCTALLPGSGLEPFPVLEGTSDTLAFNFLYAGTLSMAGLYLRYKSVQASVRGARPRTARVPTAGTGGEARG